MRKRKKLRRTKLYTRYPDMFDYIEYSDGKHTIPMNIMMTGDLIDTTARGIPYECIISKGIQAFANANPMVFPHKVLYVYVIKCTVYIVDEIKKGKISHAWRYQHSFSGLAKTFDKISAKAFKERYDGVGFNLRLRPPPPPQTGRPPGRPKGSSGTHSHIISRGALGRAQDAGLVPRSGDEEAETSRL